jgi:hypothetical protein
VDDILGFNALSVGTIDGHLSVALLLGVVLLVLVIAVLSSQSLRVPVRMVNNLFLKANLIVEDKPQVSYIRSLDLEGGQIVMSSAPKKGSQIKIDLGSLPNFPGSPAAVNGLVKRVKTFGGQPNNFLVQIEFEKANQESVSDSLSKYLKQLSV